MGISESIVSRWSLRTGARVVLALALACVGCAKRHDEPRITSYVRDGGVDDKAIVLDVEKQLSILAQGIANNDAAKIFSIFSETKPTTYVRDGKLAESVEAAQESYEKALAKLKAQRAFAFQSKAFDVLNEQTVLFTGIGVITGADMKQPWTIAYTILFSLEPAGFKAVNMHISWEEPKD